MVTGYKHVGAMASASLRFAPEVSARVNAACAIEKSLSKSILMQSRLPRAVRVNVATAIHSALLYAAATWPQLSAPQQKKKPFGITVPSERRWTGTGYLIFNLVPFLGMKFCIVQSGRLSVLPWLPPG